MAADRIQVTATLDSIPAKASKTVVQLVLDSYVTPEEIAELYRMLGKSVAVEIVDTQQRMDLDAQDGSYEAPADAVPLLGE